VKGIFRLVYDHDLITALAETIGQLRTYSATSNHDHFHWHFSLF
jgi:hypothetical protein